MLLEVWVKSGGGLFWSLCVCVCVEKVGGGVEAHGAAEARLWREVCGNGNHLSY